MANPFSTQRWLFEARYSARPAMFARGSELADKMIGQFPDLEANLPNYRMIDKAQYKILTFGTGGVAVEMEGDNDVNEFIKLATGVGKEFSAVMGPVKLLRLGLRQITLVSGDSRSIALDKVSSAFTLPSGDWSGNGERDKVSDCGIILEFRGPSSTTGRVQFGPYDRQANAQVYFAFRDHPSILEYDEGYIFDCDYGQLEPSGVALNDSTLRKWLLEAAMVSRDRAFKLYQLISPKD